MKKRSTHCLIEMHVLASQHGSTDGLSDTVLDHLCQENEQLMSIDLGEDMAEKQEVRKSSKSDNTNKRRA